MIRALTLLSILSLPAAAADCERWSYQGLRPGQDVASAAILPGDEAARVPPGRLAVSGVDDTGRRWAASAVVRDDRLITVSFRILSGDESSIDEVIDALVARWGEPVVDREEPAGAPARILFWLSRTCDVAAAASKRPTDDGADWSLLLRLAPGEDWPVRPDDCRPAIHTPGVTATRPVAVPGAPVRVPAQACGHADTARPVIVELVARADGSVNAVKVRRAASACIRDAAVSASRDWRYIPGLCGGRPVDVRMMLSLRPAGG